MTATLQPGKASPPPREGGVTRRWAIGGLLAALVASLASFFKPKTDPNAGLWLRPPGALLGDDFTDACARCFKCAHACPNDCIKFHGITAGFGLVFTPYIAPRARGCILCGECADACPTGALVPFGKDRDTWLAHVDMGVARVNKDMCYSFHGRTCGACYRACPIAGTAMKIGVFETPLVQPENCVGCGLCEQACLHLPQAIRVIPRRHLQRDAPPQRLS